MDKVKLNTGKMQNSQNPDIDQNSKRNKGDYEKGGLTSTLPGTLYQVKLSLILLKLAINKKCNFKIAAERVAAGKFDDLEIRIYEDIHKHRLYQLKHIQDDTTNISVAGLMSETNSRFSIAMYFASYRELEKTKDLSYEFVIYTNAGFKNELFNDLTHFEAAVEDEILDFKPYKLIKTPVRFKMSKEDKVRKIWINHLKKCSDLERLKVKLIACFQKDEIVIDFSDNVLKKYQKILLETVFDEGGKIFKLDFQNNSNLSEGAKLLRAICPDNVFGRIICLQNLTKYSKAIELPKEGYRDEEINDFLDQLVLAVNQPNEKELSEIIQITMGEDYNLVDSDFAANRLLSDMIEWTKNEDGHYITPESGENMLKSVQNGLSTLYFVGPTLGYCNYLNSFKLEFQEEVIGFKEFLKSNSKVFYLINPHNTLFSSIKVKNTLKSLGSYERDDSFIFLTFKTLLGLRNHIFKALQSSNLLIIEMPASNDDKDGTFLRDILRSCEGKENRKVVLIATTCFPTGSDAVQCEDRANNFTDLTKMSQDTLLDSKFLLFQGYRVPMVDVIDDNLKHLLDAEILLSLLRNEQIEIGERLKGLGEVDEYVPRIIKEIDFPVNLDFKPTMFYTAYNSDVPSNYVRSDQEILLLSNNETHFEELCIKFEEKNIHWLQWDKYDHRVLQCIYWAKSYGSSISELRKYTRKELSNTLFRNVDIFETKSKIVLIAAPPGMGKSTELTSIAIRLKEHNPTNWVLRINLVECSEHFYDTKEKYDLEKVKKILYSHLIPTKRRSKLESELFDQYFERGKVIVLLDGFDEISPYYNEKVIEILKILKESPIQRLWVTSRPYGILTQLEDALMTLSHTIQPLGDQDIKNILIKFWNDKDHASEYADTLMKRFEADKNNALGAFLGHPLNVKICGEVFRNAFGSESGDFESYLKAENLNKIDLAELYHRFFTMLFDEVFVKEKNPGLHRHRHEASTMDTIKKERKQSMELHKRLAIYALFGENAFQQLLPGEFGKLQSDLKDIDVGKYKMSIIERISENKPVFVHRTYAEYFAAVWLADEKNWSNHFVKDFLRDTVLKDQLMIVRQFFAFMLSKNDHYSRSYPIHCKVLQNDVTGLRSLLGTNADLNAIDECLGWTPLQYASQYEFLEMSELLLQCGVQTQQVTFFSDESVFFAVKKGLPLLVRYLTEVAKIDINMKKARSSTEEAPLHTAVRSGNYEMVKILLKMPEINKNVQDKYRVTPLHHAVELKYHNIAELLVKATCDSNMQSHNGNTALHLAVISCDLKMVKHLIEEGQANAEIQNEYGLSALLVAVWGNQMDIVQYLVQSVGCNKNLRDNYGDSTVHLAALFCRLDIMKYLIETAKVHPHMKNDRGYTPLHFAAHSGTFSFTGYETLINNEFVFGINYAYRESKQFSNIPRSLRKKEYRKSRLEKFNCFSTVQYLIEIVNVEINTRSNYGETVLHVAVATGNLNLVKYLVKRARIDTTILTYDGNSPLHIAAEYNRLACVRYLIEEANFDTNLRNSEGYTALHIAATNGFIRIMRYLVETANIETSILSKNGETPLHIASSLNELESAKYLVEVAKIDLKHKNCQGKTALDIARKRSYYDLIEYFLCKVELAKW